MRLAGKIAIVTGAASGIGKAAAELFRQEGATVIAADITQSEGLVSADASSESDVKMLVQKAVDEYGGLDVFFANAGITGSIQSLLDDTVENWEKVLRVNLIAPFLAIKHASPFIKKRGGGSIIVTASIAGLNSGAGPTAYSASKAGVVNLVKLASTQLASENVRINAVAPGLIETGMTQAVFDVAKSNGTHDRVGSLCAMKRAGQPLEVANAALFLASDESSFISGQTIAVDGAASASHNVAKGFTYGQISF